MVSRRFFTAVSRRCTQLEIIRIESQGAFPLYLTETAVSWCRLKTATFSGFYGIPSQFVSLLGALLDLLEVHVSCLAEKMDLTPLDGFGVLEKYYSRGCTESTEKLLQYIASPQTIVLEISLGVKSLDVQSHASDVIHHISRFTALEALCIEWYDYGEGATHEGFIAAPNIIELTSLHNLRVVTIGDTELRVQIRNEDFYNLTQAWPRLQELTIEMSPPYSTLQSLAVLREHCPALEGLRMTVDASGVSRARTDVEDWSHPSMLRVDLSESMGDVAAAEAVAYTLDVMWPNARIECRDIGSEFCIWKEVKKHMIQLREARDTQ
ncbi:hypothetical protein FRB96_006850 [Tulasnella sp. 330]|nr:hypothetical protein FRB96_006850 [Tulasnella sp. 330]